MYMLDKCWKIEGLNTDNTLTIVNLTDNELIS